MALPIGTDLGTLDTAFNGIPFNVVESKNTLNTLSLDLVFRGIPFVAALGATPLVPTTSTAQFFAIF